MNEMIGIECPVCKMYHPAPACESPAENVNMVDLNQFLTNMKTITTSQLGMKNIKDQSKFFAALTVELTKFMEGYTE